LSASDYLREGKTNMDLENFTWNQDADGIVTLAWDVPGRSMNVLTTAGVGDLALVAEKVASDSDITGLVITSGKTTGFCAGAALDEMEDNDIRQMTPEQAIVEQYRRVIRFGQALRKLETCGKPVAAAINGLALGGGLEVTLACHYRVVADNPKIQLGLPEAKVGLLPGGGGTQRLPRLIGAMQALPLILQGQSVDPQKALALKFVHAIVPASDLVANAKAWIRSRPEAAQPWDRKDFKIPGGGPYSPAGTQLFTAGSALLRKESYGNYPAQRYIMSCVYEGIQVPIDAALRIEARYFVKLRRDPTSHNMIRSLFLSMQDLGKGARRPQNEPKSEVKTLGVIGAGVMGAGIAYVSALAGIDVVLIDTTIEKANAGRDHAAQILDKQIEKGRSTPEKKAETLGHIHPAIDFAMLKHVDLLIEAVFEDRAVKAETTQKACAAMPRSAVFPSAGSPKRVIAPKALSASTFSLLSTACHSSRSSWGRKQARTRSRSRWTMSKGSAKRLSS
jgi:3-hydroxyacyl-CoA dehydrogenase/enoyl-CoA hydratase/3-hydroxybutyryl-CoA epimerase